MNKTEVIEFIENHAVHAKAEKRMKELRLILLPQLQAGEQSPLDLPYLLVLGKQERTTQDYKSPLYRLLRRILGKVRADKRLAQIEAKFESNDVPTMSVKQNQAFAAELSQIA